MKTFQEKSNIALEMIARAKLVNLQGNYNDDELIDTMQNIENEFVVLIENTLTNQNFYSVFIDWLRANVKELIDTPTNVYLILKETGLYEVNQDEFNIHYYTLENPEYFYKLLLNDEYMAKCVFKSNSPLLKTIIEEYGRKFS